MSPFLLEEPSPYQGGLWSPTGPAGWVGGWADALGYGSDGDGYIPTTPPLQGLRARFAGIYPCRCRTPACRYCPGITHPYYPPVYPS